MKHFYKIGLLVIGLFALTNFSFGQVTLISEDFESGEPSGWTNNSAYYNTGTANSGTGKAGMNGAGDWIQTDQHSNPGTLEFYARASGTTSNYTVEIQTSSNGTDWVTEDIFSADGSNGGDITDTYQLFSIVIEKEGDYYVRWEMTARSGGSFYLDDVSLVDFVASSNTQVQFESTSATVSEGDGTTSLVLTIVNEDAVATGVDVIISSDVTPTADITDIDNYTTQSVTFPSSDASSQSVMITLTDDMVYEGAEVIYFELTNISGGNNAELGSNVIFELNILDNDPLPAETLPYLEAFDSDLSGVFTYSVSGATKEWVQASGVASMNGYNSGDTEEDWLILPVINMDSYSDEVMSFDAEYNFGSDDVNNFLKVVYSTDYTGVGDPSGATWTELSYTPPASSGSIANTGDIDVSGVTGTTVYFAFQYRYESGSYRGWEIDNIVIEENPLLPEPTNHVTSFMAVADESGGIDLTWIDNDGTQAAERFLIKLSDVSAGDISDPIDGTEEADGATTANVDSGVGSYSFIGLGANTEYFFRIYPYTNSGSDIDYKTDATIPEASATTANVMIEDFSNFPETGSSYTDGTFTGNDGSTWTYSSTSGNSGEQINTPTPLLGRNQDPAGEVTSGTISGGIGTLSFDYQQAYSTNVNLEVYVNDDLITTVTSSGEQDVLKNTGGITVNVAGDFVLSFRQPSGAGQVALDNVVWTPFEACTPPSIQATTLGFSDVMETEMGLSWTRGNGDGGILIVAHEGESVDADPENTTSYTGNASFGSGDEVGLDNFVVYTGTGTDLTVTGLTQGTEYYFALYEYNSDNCYNLVALTGSQSTVTPNDENTSIVDPVSQITSQTISSLADTEGEAVEVFAFTVSDEGTDGQSTLIETMQIESNDGNNIDWATGLGGAYLNDGLTSYPLVIEEGNLMTLDLTGTPYEVINGNSVEFSLFIWLNSAIEDEGTLEFTIPTGHSFSANTSGSLFVESLTTRVAGSIHTVDVTATDFSIDASASVGIDTDFALSVTAIDENGNTDIAARNVSIAKTSGSGTLTGTGLTTQAMTDGVFEWTDLELDAADDYVLTVSDDGSLLSQTVEIEAAESTGDLFISEYIEGSGNSKAIEIYNNLGFAADLTQYRLDLYNDDGETTVSHTLELSTIAATLDAGEVLVIANVSADAAILTEADITSSVTFYGGDNPIALVKNGTIIDLFGEIGVDPSGSGWDVAGVSEATTEQTLVRKGNVTQGNPVALSSFGTNETDSEWIVYSQNDFSYIGYHILDGESFPLITVDQTGFEGSFGFVENGNQSLPSSYSITTDDLTGDLTITPPVGFELSATEAFDGTIYLNANPWVITPVDGEIDQEVFVRFNPTTADGAVYSGDITHESAGADSKSVAVNGQEGVLAADLFFSEYTESNGGNNKLIEIYNNLGATADLTQYSVELYFNESLSAGNTLALSEVGETLEDGGVIVIANSGADQALLDISDITSNVTFYNGDDALALLKNGIVIDIIGEIGVQPDPAWDVAGVAGATADHTLIRKPTISQGNPVNLGSFGTNAEDSEWIVLDFSDNSDLGSHSTEQEGDPIITVTSSISTNFGIVQVGATAEQTYDVSAVDLLDDLTITAPTGFLVSTDASTFTTSVSLSPTDGTVESTTITVQFAPDAEGNFSGNISHESTDALTKTLAVSGTAVGEEVIYFENFTSCEALNSLTSQSVDGEEVWECTPNGETGGGARISGYNDGAQNNLDWLITPGIDLTVVDAAKLSFDSDVRYTGPALEVYISTDYIDDADAASWTKLTVTLDEDADNFDTWTSSGEIDLAAYIGSTIYVGFLYSSSTEDDAATWSIDNLLVAETQPFLAADVATLGDFNQVEVGEVSTAKIFTIEGFGLTADIEITPPAQFEVSTSSDFASAGTSSSPLEITPVDGAVDQEVFVRFAPTAAGTFSGNVTITSTGFDDITLAASGVGTEEDDTALGLGDELALVIYPNPVRDAFEINNETGRKISVQVFALDGSIMSVTKRDNLYDISNLNSGVYVLVIKDESNTELSRQQIIKE